MSDIVRGHPTGGQTVVGQAPPPIPEESFTVAIDLAAVGPTTIYAPAADRRWVMTSMVVVANVATTVQFLSGAVIRTGPMGLLANVPLVVLGDAAKNIMRANNVGDTLRITLGAGVQVSGWVQLREVGQR